MVPGKERNGPVSQWDPVEHRPDRAAGREGGTLPGFRPGHSIDIPTHGPQGSQLCTGRRGEGEFKPTALKDKSVCFLCLTLGKGPSGPTLIVVKTCKV